MAQITQQPKVEVSATMTFNEQELRALDALVGYGHESFLKVFYDHLGKSYMQPYEKGLIELFESIRTKVPPILSRADKARKAFQNG